MDELNLATAKYQALVVDDDPAVCFQLEMVLTARSIAVLTANNGLDAIQVFEHHNVDIILMDVKMPKMNGFDSCAYIRTMKKGKYTPIVLITGADDHQSIKQAFDVNATDFIAKPISWPILGHRVDYLLKNSKLFKQLRHSESNLKQAQAMSLLGDWKMDLDTQVFYCSEQAAANLGANYQDIKLSGKRPFEFIHPDDRKHFIKLFNDAVAYQQSYNVDYRIVLPDGSQKSISEQAKIIHSKDDQHTYLLGTIQDVSERKQSESEIRYLAYFDTLTGLPNRDNFKKMASKAIANAMLNHQKLALIYLDLDDFKRINDTLGHNIGDQVLLQIAKNIQTALRPIKSDHQCWQLSRLGGDEFVMLVQGFDYAEQIMVVIDRVKSKINQPVMLEDREAVITSSIGVSIYPEDGLNVEALLKHADIAMYAAKKAGRDGCIFYSQTINEHSVEKLDLESKLRKALDKQEFILHYQPQVNTKTGVLNGLEALIRWQDDQGVIHSPDSFIPLAEQTGLINPIGEWVLNEVCQQMMKWQKMGFLFDKVSVNLSAKQFENIDLVTTVKNAIANAQLPARLLDIEITENMLIDLGSDTLSTLNQLKDLGVSLSIDDFGTGYCSLNYLRHLPFDRLKIDKSFVDNIVDDPADEAITKAIIELARSLSLTVVAEGVEYEEQWQILKQQNCDQIQGYIFSRPLAVEQMELYFRNNY